MFYFHLVKAKRKQPTVEAIEQAQLSESEIDVMDRDELWQARELLEKGRQQWLDGEVELALASVSEVVSLSPRLVVALEWKAQILQQLERYGETIEVNETIQELLQSTDSIGFPGFDAILPRAQTAEEWFELGNQRYLAGDLEGAIASYDRVVAINPDKHTAWSNRGGILHSIGRHDEAVASCDVALAIEPDLYEAWYGRGGALSASGRYDEAIASYDRALAIKPDKHQAWSNRGNALSASGRYDEAIASYDQALAIKPDDYKSWANRSSGVFKALNFEPLCACQRLAFGLTQPSPELLAFLQRPSTGLTLDLATCGYPGQVQTLTASLSYCKVPTYGHGFLQQWLGNAHWNQAPKEQNPRSLWQAARDTYNAALKILTATDHPKDHLKTLQALIRTHLALGDLNDASITALLRQGSDLRQRILDEATNDNQRQRLERDLPNFNQLTVDLLLRQGNLSAALATTEADKNALTQWLLAEAGATSLDIDIPQLQQQLPPHRAILYWHHSPSALTSFILLPGHPQPIALHHQDPQTALSQVSTFETWLKTWNDGYQAHIDKTKPDPSTGSKPDQSDWFQTLPQSLNQLADILRIAEIKAKLPNRITQITLIPHRDLHRLPLPSFFPAHQVTTLPSLQLSQLLRPSPFPLPETPSPRSALTITAPAHNDLAPLYHAEAETSLITQLLASSYRISNIPANQANTATVQQAFTQPHQLLHFNGHAYYNFNSPKQSALALHGSDRLTAEDLLKLDLSSYSLISLASCETALSGNQTTTSEYVGLTSVLLAKGIPHILSTLWTVESAASALFVYRFYQQLSQGQTVVTAYQNSQAWLRRLTVSELRDLYSQWKNDPAQKPMRPFWKTELNRLNTMESTATPYQHPYYWAAFTLSGNA